MSGRRQLGLASATALVVANMIGTGVFTTSGFLLGDLRSPWAVLGVWATGGVLAALGALSYGALARRIPESGGEYLFLSRTLHPAAGYLAGWISLLVGFSAPLAAAALAFGAYLKPWLPSGSPRVSGTVLVLGFAALHGAHVRRGASAQNWVVVAKVLLILAFIGFASVRLHPPPVGLAGGIPLSAFGLSLVWVSFSYSGWNAAVYIGGEVSEPERNLPRSLLLGTAIVTALYLALNAVFLFAAPAEQLSGKLEVAQIAAQALGGPTLATAVSALVALALTSSVSSMVMAGPRVYAKMAADGYLPRWLAANAGPPRAAIALQAALALALLWTATYDGLLTYIGFTLGLSTAATVVGLVRLRWREGRRLPVPGWPWVPLLFLAGVLTMTTLTIARRPRESSVGLATIAVGWAGWWAVERRLRRGH
ncbi:MAG: amino acid permease [Verrucomicrobia bacterium]|nr:amino acid permease [Verrucomicrobiota bacterium]